MKQLDRLRVVIHQYRTAPIAEVVSVLAVFFEVAGIKPIRRHLIFFLIFFLHVGRVS